MTEFLFTGSGTSQGVPVIACGCEVCQSPDPKDKRLRSSGILRSDTTTIVFDTGPDFRQQMLRADVQKLDAVVFTHQHKDHTAGMDDVRAFNFKQKRDMPIYATEAVQEHLRREFYYVFEQSDYPGVPRLKFHAIDHDPFGIGDLELLPIPAMHREMPVLGFRRGNFAYLTDANYIPSASMARLKGVKVLVLNALRKKPHHSHFTLAEALVIGEELGVEKLYLTHISHLMGRHAEVSAELPSFAEIAYDGLRLEVG
jgi:phosphoribosyl 1,2-cyclic phosphate phosphodiesterase